MKWGYHKCKWTRNEDLRETQTNFQSGNNLINIYHFFSPSVSPQLPRPTFLAMKLHLSF